MSELLRDSYRHALSDTRMPQLWAGSVDALEIMVRGAHQDTPVFCRAGVLAEAFATMARMRARNTQLVSELARVNQRLTDALERESMGASDG